MSVYRKDNKFISYLILLISLFVIVLFTKDQFNVMQEKLDSKNTYNKELKLKREKLDSINKIKNELNSNNGAEKSSEFKEVEKYNISFSENELIDYFYGYIESLESIDSKGLKAQELVIKNINFSEWIKNELWFIESNINLNISVLDENAMLKFIDFLTDEESKYKIFIETFSYPNNKKEWWLDLVIPLKLFYR